MPVTRKKAKVADESGVVKTEGGGGIPVGGDESAVDEGSAFSLEKIRLENMKRNSDFLADLGLDQDKAAWQPVDSKPSGPTRRGQGPSVKAPAEPLVIRRSGRITSERLKSELQTLKSEAGGGVDASVIAAKELELEAMMAKKYESSYQATIDAEAMEEYNRLPPDPISLLSPLNVGSEVVNAGKPLLELLRQATLEDGPKYSQFSSESAYQAALRRMAVKQDDVAKMTEGRITAVSFHPSNSKLIAMAGDKLGYLGIWDVNASASEISGGVYKYKPHVRNVANIHSWANDASRVYTTSYDGTIRYLDLEKESFSQCFEAPEALGEIIFSDTAFSPNDTHSMLIGRSDGYLCHIDLREAHNHGGRNPYSYSWNRCAQEGSKLNSVQFHPTEEHLVICGGSGRFGSITVHDMRKSTFKPLYQHDFHSKSINAAYASPDGSYLVSVSLDNTVRATSNFLSSNPLSTVLRHDNQTGRWLSTFRPAFDPKRSNIFILGSMDKPRRVEYFSINSGRSGDKKESPSPSISCLHTVQGEYLASVCSRNCFHPTLDVVAAGNSSGRVHIIR